MSIERRRFPRRSDDRPCKILHRASPRFAPGRTTNTSAGGALIRILSSRRFDPGESIDLAIARPDAAILTAADLLPARIIRVEPGEDSLQTLAVEFAPA